MVEEQLSKLIKLVRYFILISTSSAGSGHPTSSLSAVELMTVLFFKYLKSGRMIFSKGVVIIIADQNRCGQIFLY